MTMNQPEAPSVAVLVLNFNGKHHLDECFKSLQQTRYPLDIFCIDNASTDGSVEWMKAHFPEINLIAFDKNWGFTGAYNLSVDQVPHKYVVFLNNDTVVDPNWLSELVKAAESEEKIAICGSKLLYFDKPNVINHAGGKITLIGSGFDAGMGIENDSQLNTPHTSGLVCGASLLIKRDVFLQLGGFDNDYFAYFEDVDLCWRAWLNGYKVLTIPSSIVYHKYGGSFGSRRAASRVFHCLHNRVANMIKNLSWSNLILGVFVSFAYEGLRFIMFLREKNWPAAGAIVRGFLACVSDLPKSFKKRKVIQKKRKVSDQQLIKMGVISTLKESYQEFRRLEKRG